MFEYDPHTEEQLATPREEYVEDVGGASSNTKLTPSQLVHTAINNDQSLGSTLRAIKSAEDIEGSI